MIGIIEIEKKRNKQKEKVSHCFLCGNQEQKIVRLSHDYDEEAKKVNQSTTQNFTEVCTNPKCLFYIDLSKVKTWKRV